MLGNEIKHPVGECYGSTVVGSRGQMVIPVDARRDLDIDVGTKLLAFNFFEGRALLLFKANELEQLIRVISSRVSELEFIAKQIASMTTEIDGESN